MDTYTTELPFAAAIVPYVVKVRYTRHVRGETYHFWGPVSEDERGVFATLEEAERAIPRWRCFGGDWSTADYRIDRDSDLNFTPVILTSGG